MGKFKRPWCCSLLLFFPYLSFFIIIIQFTYGAYNEQYLDSMGCSSKRILLSDFINNTLVMKLSRWEDYHLPSAFMNFQCKFKVVAPRGHGIMVITQGLHLRTKSKQSQTCRDYIKFEQNDGRETRSICGEVNVSDHNMNPDTLIGPRTFYDPNGELDVFFSADESSTSEIQKPIFLQLIFTSYSECTSIDLMTHRLRSCSEGKGNACIASNLFCDGIINCGFKGDFASDERNCGSNGINNNKLNENEEMNNILLENKIKNSRVNIINEESHSSSSSSDQFDIGSLPVHVFALISAATGGLLVLLVIFLCCCLGRYGRLSPRNQNLRQSQTNQETIHIGGVPHSSVVTSGPSFISRMTPSSKLVKPKEDLPPPYEAIFPEPKQPEKK